MNEYRRLSDKDFLVLVCMETAVESLYVQTQSLVYAVEYCNVIANSAPDEITDQDMAHAHGYSRLVFTRSPFVLSMLEAQIREFRTGAELIEPRAIEFSNVYLDREDRVLVMNEDPPKYSPDIIETLRKLMDDSAL